MHFFALLLSITHFIFKPGMMSFLIWKCAFVRLHKKASVALTGAMTQLNKTNPQNSISHIFTQAHVRSITVIMKTHIFPSGYMPA